MASPATSYRITAVVDGLEKIEALKQTIKLLANSTTPAAEAVSELRQKALELGNASNASTKDIRTAVDALKGLKDAVSLTSSEYKVLTGDIQSIGSRLDSATGSVTRHTQAQVKLGQVVNANSRAINNYFNNAAVRQQEQLNQRIQQQMRTPTLALPAAGQSSFKDAVDASGFGGGARRGTGTKESPFEIGSDPSSRQRYMGAPRSDSEVAAAAGYLERDAAAAKTAAAAANQYQSELEQLFNSIRKYQGQQVANKNQQVAYSYRDLAEEIERVTISSNGSLNSLRQQRQLWEQLYNSVGAMDPAYAKARANMQRLDKEIGARTPGGQNRLQRFGQTAGAIAASGVFGGPEGAIGAGLGAIGGPGGALAGGAIGAQVGMLRQQLGGTATYSADLEKQRIALKLIIKDTTEYNSALSFLAQTSKEYAIPQDRLIKGFTQISASVIGAGGNIQDAKTAFEGITAGIRGTGRSLDDLDGALLATAQVFSKGKVSAEELRGQIGERLPGAYNLFAQAIGKTPQELDKALERGEVSLADFLQFSKKVFGEYGENAKIIADSPEAAGDRLQTSLKNLSENVGKLLRPIGAAFQTTFASIIEKINQAAATLANFLGMNKTNAQRIGQLNNLIITQQKGIAREQLLVSQGSKSKKEAQYAIDEFNTRIAELQAKAKALKALEGASQDQGKPRPSLADSVATPAAGSTDDGSKKIKDAAKAAADAALQQQRLNEETTKAQIELDNDRFRYAQELIRKQYEYEQELQNKTRDNWVKSQTGAARTAAGIISSYFGELQDLESRLFSAKEGLEQARQQSTSAARMAAVTSAGVGTPGSSNSNAVSRLFEAANSKLGLFAGQTERCADAIRELFKVAGIAIGTTKKAWDGLSSGASLASSFFGSDIGQRINKREDLRPGDLVGFDRTYGSWGKGVQTHVGMYAGDGMMYDHSSRRGLTKRPLDTFAGKFLYGVRPNALAGGTPGENAQQRRAVKAEGKAGEGDLAVTAAQQQLALIEGQYKKLKEQIGQGFVLEFTSQLKDQIGTLKDSNQELELRAQLQEMNMRPEFIEAEMQKSQAFENYSKQINNASDALQILEDKGEGNSEQATRLRTAIQELINLFPSLDAAIEKNAEIQAKAADKAKSFSTNFKETIQGYYDQISNLGASVGNAVTGTFKGLEDQLVSFVTTGKANFAELAKSILADIARIAIQQAIIKPLLKGVGSIFGVGLVGNANGNVFAQGGLQPYAMGASFGAGTTRFANGGIVTRPTMFKFANGGQMQNGVMGEAGPEAIMPLQRGTDGKLGVKASLNNAMSRYSKPSGAESGMAGGGESESMAKEGARNNIVDVRYTVERINSVDYVTADQFQQGMIRAAQQGAKQGEQNVLRKMQQSPSVRRRVGMN